MEVRRTALVIHSAERMFDLIEAAEHYPVFLPWCASAQILQRDEQVVAARIEVAYLGARFGFTTRNPKRRPEWMAIGLEEGPFKRFDGSWQLRDLPPLGCRIEFVLRYDFASTTMGRLASPVFHRIADTLVDAFIQRADRLYGSVATPAPGPVAAPPAPAPVSPPAAAPPPASAPEAASGTPLTATAAPATAAPEPTLLPAPAAPIQPAGAGAAEAPARDSGPPNPDPERS
jgi:ribosome-associated toxin RatA of RatAB toxin-antitoxin module